MLPLLQKFQVRTLIGNEIASWTAPDIIGEDSEGELILGSPEPDVVFEIHLEPDGKLYHEDRGKVKINDIDIEVFLRPQDIIDKFLDSIREGVNYRKEQSKEIDMAKTIIDAITKGTISKVKSKGKRKRG